MGKSKNFSGQPIISQILNFLPNTIITRTAKEYNSDRHYKRFKTYDHLVTMILLTLVGCSSLWEISSIMLACQGRINHLGLSKFPKRSTLSDAIKIVQVKSLRVFTKAFIIVIAIFYRIGHKKASRRGSKDC